MLCLPLGSTWELLSTYTNNILKASNSVHVQQTHSIIYINVWGTSLLQLNKCLSPILSLAYHVIKYINIWQNSTLIKFQHHILNHFYYIYLNSNVNVLLWQILFKHIKIYHKWIHFIFMESDCLAYFQDCANLINLHLLNIQLNIY